jgi:hypothetical protein
LRFSERPAARWRVSGKSVREEIAMSTSTTNRRSVRLSVGLLVAAITVAAAAFLALSGGWMPPEIGAGRT